MVWGRLEHILMSSDSMCVLLRDEGAQPVLSCGAVPAGWDLQPSDAISTAQLQPIELNPTGDFLPLFTLLSYSMLKQPLRRISSFYEPYTLYGSFSLFRVHFSFVLFYFTTSGILS